MGVNPSRRSTLQAGLIAVSLGLFSTCSPPRDEATDRSLEARLAATQRFVPCREITPPRGPLRFVECGEALPPRSALALLRRSESSRSGPLRAARLRIAASSETANLARALAQIAAAAPRSADLDVAQGGIEHALALRTGDPSLLVAALEHTEAGWEAAPGSPAAGFNRALISAELGLCRRAVNLWRSYLSLDAHSPWAGEARARLSSLPCGTDPQAVTPDRLMDRVHDHLLPAWAQAPQADAAATALAELKAVGEELRRGGEPFVTRLADELRRLGGDPAYARAVADYTRGWAAFDAERYRAAGGRLRRALPVLEGRASVLSPWCQIWLAGLDLYGGRFAAARERLAGAGDGELARESPMLEGRIFWTLGLAALRAGELGPSFDFYTRAARAFERGGYAEPRAAMQVARAEVLGGLGLAREGWRERVVALRDLQARHPPFTLHNALLDAAREAGHQGFHRAAEAFLQEAVLRAQDLDEALFLTEALLAQGDAAARSGDRAAARESFTRALEASLRLPPGVVRQRYEANARLGLLAQADAGARRLDELEAVATFYAGKGPRWRQILVLRLEAEARRASGDASGAARALGRALEVVRLQRDGLGSETTELAFLATTRSLFDDRVGAAVENGEDRLALIYLEESRQLAGGAASEPAALSALLERRRESVVVVFGFVGDDLLWWRLVDGALASGRVSAAAVQAAVDPLIAPAGHRLAEADLERAFEGVLAPAIRGAPADRRLALVPDGPLHRVPFAALRNPATGVRLVEERAITMHPTLTDALTSGERQPEPDRHSWRAVAVGDPTFDETALESLPRLAGAAREARDVAALYGPDAVLLTAAQATPRAVREALSDAQVFHLAAHAVPGEERSHGALVLAAEPAGGGTGLVPAEELLPETVELELVVLSACSSLGHESTRAAGAMGPARPFLRRGVPAVLATLWPIADESLDGLMVDFHQGLLDGLAASEALRRAQIRAAHRDIADTTNDWAALQLVGELPATTDH